MKIASFAAAALFLAAIATPASAQYPTKPVRIIVPVTTGGPSDLVARILGDKLAASMTVGTAVVAKSEPDGYTLLLAQMVPLGEMTEIQYKGSSAAHPDLISNRITFMIDPLAASALAKKP